MQIEGAGLKAAALAPESLTEAEWLAITKRCPCVALCASVGEPAGVVVFDLVSATLSEKDIELGGAELRLRRVTPHPARI